MELYTIKELAKLANTPESTARYYRDRHPEYFYHTGTGRKKRYPKETLDVLKFILRLAEERRNAEQIAEALKGKFKQEINILDTNAEAQRSSNANEEGQLQLMNTLTNTLREIADQKKEMQNLRDEINQLKDYIKTPVLKRIFRRGK